MTRHLDLDGREIARVEALMADPKTIFVFGSNDRGAHGGGAARVAHREYEARWGVAEGLTGQAYAIPTMDLTEDRGLVVRSLAQIGTSVAAFLNIAQAHPELRFAVTRIGCGIAGYEDEDIAPMFADAPANCELPEGWRR